MSPLLSNISFGIYILNLLRKSSSPSQVLQYSSDCFHKYFNSVHWGLNTQLFLAKSHLKLANSPSPPFLGNLPTSTLAFREPPSPP